MRNLIKKIKMFLGVWLTPEEKQEVYQAAKNYARKHTFQLPKKHE